MTSDGSSPSEWFAIAMWNWTQRTWHVSRDCPAVLSDVPDTHEVKESAQQADGWAQQEAVLQAAEAPVRRLRVHALYAVGNLRAHRWRWNWASVSGGREDTSAAIYLRSCGWRSTHQSHKVGTSWVPQEVDDCDLESFGRWPSVWYDDVLKWKGTKITLLVSSVFSLPSYVLFILFSCITQTHQQYVSHDGPVQGNQRFTQSHENLQCMMQIP